MPFDWGFAVSIMPVLLAATVVTVEVTLVAFALAVLGGLVLALLLRSTAWTAWLTAAVIEFVRSTPLLIQAFAAYFLLPDIGIPLDPFATGAVVLGLHYACYAAHVFRGAIDGVARGQWEAAFALGLRRPAVYSWVVVPQAARAAVPPLGNYLIAMFKDVPVLSAITLVELMYTANQIASEKFLYVEPMTMVGLIYLVLSLLAAAAVRGLERRLSARP